MIYGYSIEIIKQNRIIRQKNVSLFSRRLYDYLETNEEIKEMYLDYMERCNNRNKSHRSLDSWIRHRGIGIDHRFRESIYIKNMKGDMVVFNTMRELSLYWTIIRRE